MDVVITMSFSGSCMLILYFAVKFLSKGHITKRTLYFILKIVAIYFLVPIPFVGTIYRYLSISIGGNASYNSMVYHSDELVLIETGREYLLNESLRQKLIVVGIWFLVALGIMIYYVVKYFLKRKKLTRCKLILKDKADEKLLDGLKEKYVILRKVELYSCEKKNLAFTIGLLCPIIVWQKPEDEKEQKFVLTHELIHIKRCDMVWKILASAVLTIHWFNPLAYVFLRELEDICEESCDEWVVQGCTEEERNLYACMLVKRSIKNQGDCYLKWRMALSQKAQRMLGRVDNIMQTGCKKIWNRKGIGMMVAVLTVMNSLTALAYEDTKLVRIDAKTAKMLGLENGQNSDGEFMSNERMLQKLDEFDLEINELFLYQNGGYSIHDIMDTEHEHEFEYGLYEQHIPNKDEGCVVTLHEAVRCYSCRQIWVEYPLVLDKYKKCNH